MGGSPTVASGLESGPALHTAWSSLSGLGLHWCGEWARTWLRVWGGQWLGVLTWLRISMGWSRPTSSVTKNKRFKQEGGMSHGLFPELTWGAHPPYSNSRACASTQSTLMPWQFCKPQMCKEHIHLFARVTPEPGGRSLPSTHCALRHGVAEWVKSFILVSDIWGFSSMKKDTKW